MRKHLSVIDACEPFHNVVTHSWAHKLKCKYGNKTSIIYHCILAHMRESIQLQEKTLLMMCTLCFHHRKNDINKWHWHTSNTITLGISWQQNKTPTSILPTPRKSFRNLSNKLIWWQSDSMPNTNPLYLYKDNPL
jgi:hypothetical protein